MTLSLLRRAEKSGYKALILTVDTPLAGKRLADDRNQFSLPPQYRWASVSPRELSLTHAPTLQPPETVFM